MRTVCLFVSNGIQLRFVNTVGRTADFDRWLAKLKDLRGKARIVERIRSAERGFFGDCVLIDSGVSEMRMDSFWARLQNLLLSYR